MITKLLIVHPKNKQSTQMIEAGHKQMLSIFKGYGSSKRCEMKFSKCSDLTTITGYINGKGHVKAINQSGTI